MIQQIFSRNYWASILLLTEISIKKRNANSYLGRLWSLIQPFLNILVIAYVMTFVLRYSPGVIVPNLIGALPFWIFLTQSITTSAESLVNKGEVLKRVQMSKTYFPIAEVMNGLYTLAYSFIAMYLVLILLYPASFTWKVVLVPFYCIPMIITVMSASIMMAFVTVYIRDMTQVLTVIFSVLYWTLPIIYPYALVPDDKKIIYDLNPLFLILRPMQEIITTRELPSMALLYKSWLVPIFTTILSFIVYRKLTRNVIYYV